MTLINYYVNKLNNKELKTNKKTLSEIIKSYKNDLVVLVVCPISFCIHCFQLSKLSHFIPVA